MNTKRILSFGALSFIPPPTPECDFPTDILRWMKQNAKPMTALKLMESNKYFCHKKFPYLVITRMDYSRDYVIYELLDKKSNKENAINFASKKIWITGTFAFYGMLTKKLPKFPNIVANDITFLIMSDQLLTFNEFKILTSSKKLEKAEISGTYIRFDTGVFIHFEDILSCIPYVKEFILWNPIPSIKCINELCKHISSKLESLTLFANETFELESFTQLFEKKPHVQYHLAFDAYLSKKYIKQLKSYVDEIIKIGLTEYPPFTLFLMFNDQSNKSYRALEALNKKFTEGKKEQKKKFCSLM